MNVPVVWVMGGPGSGKTTLSQKLVQKFGYKHIDINALVDKEIETKTDRGNQFAALINAGKIVPMTDLIQSLEMEVMGNHSGLNGLVIDGYPQNRNDAQVLEHSLGVPDLIIALDVGLETLNMRRSVNSTRSSITAATYIRDSKEVLSQYASRAMYIDSSQDANATFETIVPNIEALVDNWQPLKAQVNF